MLDRKSILKIVLPILSLGLLIVLWRLSMSSSSDTSVPDEDGFCRLENSTFLEPCLQAFRFGKEVMRKHFINTKQLNFPTYEEFQAEGHCKNGTTHDITACLNAEMSGSTSVLTQLSTQQQYETLSNINGTYAALLGIGIGLVLASVAPRVPRCLKERTPMGRLRFFSSQESQDDRSTPRLLEQSTTTYQTYP